MAIQKLNIPNKTDNAAKKKMVQGNTIGANETLMANEVNALVAKTNELVDAYNFGAPITAFNFKTNVATYADLPTIGNEVNDGYGVIADGLVYVWNGTAFPPDGDGMNLGLKPDENSEVEEGNLMAVNGDRVAVAAVLKSSIKYQSVNIADKSTFINNEYVNYLSGNFIENSEYVRTDFIEIIPDTDISVRRGLNLLQTAAFYDENKVYISGVGDISTANGYIGKSPANARYMVGNVSRYLSTREIDIDLFMISFSPESLPYEPFSHEIKEIGGGIIPKTEVETIVGVNIADKSTFVNNQYVNYTTGLFTSNSQYVRTDFIEILPNADISIRRNNNITQSAAFYDENKAYISGVGNINGVNGYLGKSPEGSRYMIANVSNSLTNRQIDIDAFMLSYSLAPLPYEPYTRYVSKLNQEKVYTPDFTTSDNTLTNIWKGLRAVINGDSITAPADSYIIRALQALGIVVVQNYGIGGSTIARRESDPTERNPIVDRYAEMIDENIDLVIISATTNDCNYSWTPFGDFSDRIETTYLGAMHLLCERLLKKYIGKQILFITPIKRFQDLPTPESTNAYGKTQKDYADAMKQVCSYWGIPVLDLFSESLINAFIPEHRAAYMTDGTHPNAAGKQIMANRLSGFLKQLR